MYLSREMFLNYSFHEIDCYKPLTRHFFFFLDNFVLRKICQLMNEPHNKADVGRGVSLLTHSVNYSNFCCGVGKKHTLVFSLT